MVVHIGAVLAAVELKYATEDKEYDSDAAYPPSCGYCRCEAGYNQEDGSYNVADKGKCFHIFSSIEVNNLFSL